MVHWLDWFEAVATDELSFASLDFAVKKCNEFEPEHVIDGYSSCAAAFWRLLWPRGIAHSCRMPAAGACEMLNKAGNRKSKEKGYRHSRFGEARQ
jgi:hypothetical protein